MASYNFKIEHFLFLKSLSLFYLLTITHFFSVQSPVASAILSFNFPNFISGDSRIKYDRAFAEGQVIQLTNNKVITGSIGRATYFSPMHLWDKASGKLTDFTTHFSFAIDSQNGTNYGDGLAFFLAPTATGSTVPNNVTIGSSLGLTNDNQVLNSTNNPFVAVEFDIYPNKGWDPQGWPGVHLGIDINSMKSVANVSWERWWSNTSITQGLINEARITYNSTSHNLSLLLTAGFINNSKEEQSLSYQVDLRDYLPEWVTFGFSAATGASPAMHTIYTWNFTSTLEDNVTEPTVAGSPSPTPAPNGSKNKLGLAVGLGVGGSFLFGGLALILFCMWKRTRSHTEEDLALDSCMDDEFQMGTGPKRFSFKELAHATNNFNEEEKLGQGGFGGVYRGFLRDSNSFVAVKRVSKESKQGIKEYASEVKIISRLRHRNLVQLIGLEEENSYLSMSSCPMEV
jgi:hypothetical protein